MWSSLSSIPFLSLWIICFPCCSFQNWKLGGLWRILTLWCAALQCPHVHFYSVLPYRSSLLPEHQQFLSRCSGQRVNINVSGAGSGDLLDSQAPALFWCCPLGRPLLSLRAVLPFCWYCPGSWSQGDCPSVSQSAQTVPGCAVRSWPNPIACCGLLCLSPCVCKRLLQGSPLLSNMLLFPTELHLQPKFKDKSTEKFKIAAVEGWPNLGPLQCRSLVAAQPGLHKPLGSFLERNMEGSRERVKILSRKWHEVLHLQPQVSVSH